MAEKRKTFFNVPLSSHPDTVTSESLRKVEEKDKPSVLKTYKSIYDAGGPIAPVRSTPRNTATISANTGLNRLKELPIGSELLQQKGLASALLGNNVLESLTSLTSPENVGQAGVPFSAYKTKGIDKVFHGTQKSFEKFDPSVYDEGDVLGWLTHFAEDPAYAGQYATGAMKSKYGPTSPTTILANIEAKNVLDLVDPNADDMSQALAFMHPEQRRYALSMFKQAKRNPTMYKDYLKPSHYPDKDAVPNNEVPLRTVASALRLDKKATDAMPFDAIRYHDMDEKSWAVPAKTKIKSIFGHDYTPAEEVSSIRGIRDDNVSTGLFPVLGNINHEKDIKKKIDQFLASGHDINSLLDSAYAHDLNLGKYSKEPKYSNIAIDYLNKKKQSGDLWTNESAKTTLNEVWKKNNIPKYTSTQKPLDTKYIGLDKDGYVKQGSGDKEYSQEIFDDLQWVENPDFKKKKNPIGEEYDDYDDNYVGESGYDPWKEAKAKSPEKSIYDVPKAKVKPKEKQLVAQEDGDWDKYLTTMNFSSKQGAYNNAHELYQGKVIDATEFHHLTNSIGKFKWE